MDGRYERKDVVKHVGDIMVFRFPENTPDDFLGAHPRPSFDTFVVYNNYNGNPSICKWRDNAFWTNSGGGPGDWKVLLNAEYWFRIPTTKEIVDGEQKDQSE
jgi:hypothetical protein